MQYENDLNLTFLLLLVIYLLKNVQKSFSLISPCQKQLRSVKIFFQESAGV